MNQFLKGWRRKVGVVTVAMACAFALGWVRSTTQADFLGAICDGTTAYSVVSTDGRLAFHATSFCSLKDRIDGNPDVVPSTTIVPLTVQRTSQSQGLIWGTLKREWFAERIGIRAGNFDVAWDVYDIDWKRELGPLEIMTATNGTRRAIKTVLPYWSIALPLTMLSVWLLLSKPSALVERRTSDSVRETAT